MKKKKEKKQEFWSPKEKVCKLASEIFELDMPPKTTCLLLNLPYIFFPP